MYLRFGIGRLSVVWTHVLLAQRHFWEGALGPGVEELGMAFANDDGHRCSINVYPVTRSIVSSNKGTHQGDDCWRRLAVALVCMPL